MSTKALTLYELEDDLAAMLETGEGGIEPDQEAEYEQALAEALTKTVEKRDRCAQFLAHCDAQVKGIDAEISRLASLRDKFERAGDRMEDYIRRTILALGRDAKGKMRKLEGRTCCFSLAAKPAKAEITDEPVVPAIYKRVTVTAPATTWDELLGALFPEDRERILANVRATCAVELNPLKAALKGGHEIPGAVLRGDTDEDRQYRLKRD